MKKILLILTAVVSITLSDFAQFAPGIQQLKSSSLILRPANGRGPIEEIEQPTGSADARPISDADIKGATPPSNTLYVVFTNAGPCTIQSIRVDMSWINPTLIPILSIFEDGISNGCQLTSFFSAQGYPSLAFHGDSIDLQTVPAAFGQLCGNRQVSVNCKTNGSVCLTFASNNFTLWSDVIYRVGSPVTSNSYHMLEAQQTTSPGSVFSIASLSGVVGQLESITMFALANGGQSYLESRPTVYLDGNAPVLANGTEDFFGGSFYFNLGLQAYGTTQWGNESENFLTSKYGFSDGNCSYRFFQNAYFSSSLRFNYTNTSAVSISNDFLMTYWSTP